MVSPTRGLILATAVVIGWCANGASRHDPALTAEGPQSVRLDPGNPSLRALWQYPPNFHDGSAQTLPDLLAHHGRLSRLQRTAQQQRGLVEYLKSQ